MLRRWGNIIAADCKVYQVQEYLEEKIGKVSANSFNVYRDHGMTVIRWAIKLFGEIFGAVRWGKQTRLAIKVPETDTFLGSPSLPG